MIHTMRTTALLASLVLALGVPGVGMALPCPAEVGAAATCGCAAVPSCCCRQADPLPVAPPVPAISAPAPVDGFPAGLPAEEGAAVPASAAVFSPAAEDPISVRPAAFLLACAFLC